MKVNDVSRTSDGLFIPDSVGRRHCAKGDFILALPGGLTMPMSPQHAVILFPADPMVQAYAAAMAAKGP
jgi:hypothetical protein